METKAPFVFFAEIYSETPADLEDRLLFVLRQHRGQDNRITRRRLLEIVFEITLPDDVNLTNLTEDRQMRMTLESLRSRFPILATTGGGGYYYCSSIDEANQYAAELVSRATSMLETARSLVAMAEEEYGAVQQLGLFV